LIRRSFTYRLLLYTAKDEPVWVRLYFLAPCRRFDENRFRYYRTVDRVVRVILRRTAVSTKILTKLAGDYCYWWTAPRTLTTIIVVSSSIGNKNKQSSRGLTLTGDGGGGGGGVRVFTAITSDDRLLFDADETAGVSGCVRSRGCCAPPLLDVKHARPRAPKYIYIYRTYVRVRGTDALFIRARGRLTVAHVFLVVERVGHKSPGCTEWERAFDEIV